MPAPMAVLYPILDAAPADSLIPNDTVAFYFVSGVLYGRGNVNGTYYTLTVTQSAADVIAQGGPLTANLDLDSYNLIDADTISTADGAAGVAGATLTLSSGVGNAAAGTGATVTIAGGGTSGAGGAIAITGGAGTAGDAGGAVTVFAGIGNAAALSGSRIYVNAGATDGAGGALTFNAGNSDTAKAGGDINLVSGYGNAGGTINQPELHLRGGSAAGAGGNVEVTAGAGEAATSGGSISLVAGTGDAGNDSPASITIGGGNGAGVDGAVSVAGRIVSQAIVHSVLAWFGGGQSIGAHPAGVVIPQNSIIIGGMVDVVTTVTTDGADAGTLALHVESANDIVTAIAVSDGTNPWDAGLHDVKPIRTAATSFKTTTARDITLTIGGQAMTGGGVAVLLYYIVSTD